MDPTETKETRTRMKLINDSSQSPTKKSKPVDTNTQLKEKAKESQHAELLPRRKALEKMRKIQQPPSSVHYPLVSAKEKKLFIETIQGK